MIKSGKKLINEYSVQSHRDKIGFRMSCLIGVNFSVGFNVTHSRHVISLDIIACFTQGWANNSSSRGIESRKGDFFFFPPKPPRISVIRLEISLPIRSSIEGALKDWFRTREREKKKISSVRPFYSRYPFPIGHGNPATLPSVLYPEYSNVVRTPYIYTQHGSLEKNPSVPSYECGLLILNYTPRVVRTQSAAAVNVGKALEGEKCFES